MLARCARDSVLVYVVVDGPADLHAHAESEYTPHTAGRRGDPKHQAKQASKRLHLSLRRFPCRSGCGWKLSAGGPLSMSI